MEEKKIICIGCPKGCDLKINHIGKEIQEILNFGCEVGLEYAKNEFIQPKRIITTTVKLNSGSLPFVPAKTREPVNKERIFEIMNIISGLEVQAPIKIGDIILKNIGETGVDLVCTRNIKKAV